MRRIIGIKGPHEFLVELERDWVAIDKGEPPPEPVHRVYFESPEALTKVITRQRHNLLKVRPPFTREFLAVDTPATSRPWSPAQRPSTAPSRL